MNGTDLRYRMRILPWWAKISVSFYPHLIDIESIAALVDFGGSLGIGDGRPSSPKSLSGTWGTWKLVEREPS
jgi:hypothetical protein